MSTEPPIGSRTGSRLSAAFRDFSGRGHPSTSILLAILLATDLTFLFIGGLQRFTDFADHPLLVLTTDGGYPEFFQYLKLFWTAFMLLLVAFWIRSVGMALWSAVFIAFGLYDSLTIHERLGSVLGDRYLNRSWPAGLEPSDIGELIAQGFLAGLAVLAVGLSLWRGPETMRRFTVDMLLLVGALALFGVAIDFIHALLQLGTAANFAAGFIEDGGEMIVTSVICWYAFVVSSSGGLRTHHLADYLPFRSLGEIPRPGRARVDR